MANLILLKTNGTPIVWADTTDYAGAGGTRTHQITLAGLATTNGRAGEKADMDTGQAVANRQSQRWAATLRVEMAVAPVDGITVELYWAASLSATAATANPAQLTGADEALTAPTAGQLGQLQWIGSLTLQALAVTYIQQKTFITTLPTQWGMPVVVNRSAQAFDADDIQMSVTLTPLEDEAQ